jgi:uncharacterized repeat protein (TIGR03803 family)
MVTLIVAAGLTAAPRKPQTYKEEILYSFKGSEDGANPFGGLVSDSAGNLYGTTNQGGTYNLGTVFKLEPSGKETVIHTFDGQADGANPLYVTLVRDSSGNLYGTTYAAGIGRGVVFKMDPRGKETVLRTLTQGTGYSPFAGVILDSKGKVYATTTTGGSENGGTVFRTTGIEQGKVLYNFIGNHQNGTTPTAPLVRDAAGNLYGTASGGGASGNGTVFKLNVKNKPTLLHAFSGNPDGSLPYGGLILDSEGNLYGATNEGGTSGIGTVYKVSLNGKETVLYSFQGMPDGANPGAGSLTMDTAGNLYGTTLAGGSHNYGTVFELSTAGKETVLYSFAGGGDGVAPEAGLTWDAKGNLYGTTSEGGQHGQGSVFKLTPK